MEALSLIVAIMSRAFYKKMGMLPITTEWQKVTIPLKRFKTVDDWRNVNVFSINFEYAFDSKKGSILIDDIVFEK